MLTDVSAAAGPRQFEASDLASGSLDGIMRSECTSGRPGDPPTIPRSADNVKSSGACEVCTVWRAVFSRPAAPRPLPHHRVHRIASM